MRELVHRLAGSLAAVRRDLLQSRECLVAGRSDHGAAGGAIDRALAENDAAYAALVRLRWSLLRRTEPQTIPQREGDEMNGSRPMVFVVDDSPSVRRALSRLLQSVGLQVEVFGSARQFLDHPLPDVSCCVVLDVRMPRMSGLDLQQELAARGSDVPIVFITGHGDIDMAVRAMKDGAVDFLPKPFNDQDLIDAINRALDKDQARREEQAGIAEIQARLDRLTPRERQVMELVITGILNKQIASELGTGEKTIKVHRSRVMEKMEARSVAELVKLAARVGIEGPSFPEE
ncbi:MAG: response regulator transcription factor [Candidatus Krumholzibacteriia bacterium]